MNDVPVLEGERIRLRPMTEDDATQEYVDWLNDPDINRYLESRFSEHSPGSIRDYIAALRADPAARFFAIERSDDGRHVGNIKLGGIDTYHGFADIGVLIGDRRSWGQGFASEAIRLLTQHAFDDLGLHKVWAGSYGANVGSIKAFEKVGYSVEGRLAGKFRSGDGRDDWVLLGITRDAFNA